MSTRLIHINGPDMLRLRQLLAMTDDGSELDREHLELLRQELDWAVVVSAEDTPADVITMGTQVRVRDIGTGQRQDYTLVYPWEADLALGRISVLAPMGTALIGHRSGDEFVCAMPGVSDACVSSRSCTNPRRRNARRPCQSVLAAATRIDGRRLSVIHAEFAWSEQRHGDGAEQEHALELKGPAAALSERKQLRCVHQPDREQHVDRDDDTADA